MNKRIVAAGVAAVAVAVLPVGLAWKAEEQLRLQVASANDRMQRQKMPLRIVLKDYQRGYASSTGVYRLEVMDPKTGASEGCVDFSTELSHSPLQLVQGFWVEARSTLIADTAQSDCDFAQSIQGDKDARKLYEQFGEEGPLEIRSGIGVSGGLQHEIKLQAFRLAQPAPDGQGEVIIQVRPASLAVASDMQASFIRSSGEWGGIEVSALGARMVFDGFTLSVDQRRAGTALQVGEGRVAIRGLTAENLPDARVHRFSVAGVETSGMTDVKNGELLSSGEIRIQDVRVNDLSFGDWRMRISVGGIDALQADKLAVALDDLNAEGLPVMTETEAGQRALEALLKSVLKQAELKIDPVEINLGGETARIQASGRSVNLGQADFQTLAISPVQIWNLIEGDAELTFGRAFVEKAMALVTDAQGVQRGRSAERTAQVKLREIAQAMELLDQYTQTGMLDYDASGKHYRFKAAIKDGVPSINGQPLK
ncbi:DUF945 family protein [Hahella sp. SMD15-11]|uniref:DUF945 family protein n=1 Tax=Thermohahella caldifontis TaxID=3142973 RepID=A0AB39URD0_9GAMM